MDYYLQRSEQNYNLKTVPQSYSRHSVHKVFML